MKSIKGTCTEQNLLKAFAGESQARNRYTFFAKRARNPRNELHVQTSMRNIVVFAQGKHLRFVRIAVVVRTMQNFIHVADKRSAPYACVVVRIVFSAERVAIVKTSRWARALGDIPVHTLCDFF